MILNIRTVELLCAKLLQASNSDRIIPVGITDVDLEVVVIVQPIVKSESAKTPEELGWPPGFFERTAGAWQGEPFTRGEQGEYPERDQLL